MCPLEIGSPPSLPPSSLLPPSLPPYLPPSLHPSLPPSPSLPIPPLPSPPLPSLPPSFTASVTPSLGLPVQNCLFVIAKCLPPSPSLPRSLAPSLPPSQSPGEVGVEKCIEFWSHKIPPGWKGGGGEQVCLGLNHSQIYPHACQMWAWSNGHVKRGGY